MTEQAIRQRLQELTAMAEQQQQRLNQARQEQAYAVQSLERIEGARQDCDFWLSQVQPAEAPTVEPQDILPFPGKDQPAAPTAS